jgi:hypothetical protein
MQADGAAADLHEPCFAGLDLAGGEVGAVLLEVVLWCELAGHFGQLPNND